MKLLRMLPGRPQCFLYAAAMILNVEPGILMGEIGHDGMDVWWPSATGDQCYRGFHPQEIVDAAFRRGKYLLYIDPIPASAQVGIIRQDLYQDPDARFFDYIIKRRAIFAGCVGQLQNHAVAWDGKKIYDPHGKIYQIKEFEIREAFVLI